MINLEENIKKITDMQQKLKNLGDSLWHFKIRNRINKFRTRDNKRWILEWPKRV